MSWFIGVPVALHPDGSELPPAEPGLVALAPSDRHVTLAFLGRAPDDDVRAVWSAVPRVVLPCELDALRWERFGRSALALVVSDVDRRLEAAAEACHRAADGVIQTKRPTPFRPHVTMARVPRRAHAPSASALRGWTVPARALSAGPLTLFRSATDGRAGRYEVVDERRPSA